MAAGEGFGAGAPETFTRSRGVKFFQARAASPFQLRAFVDFGQNAPLRLRRWLRVKVSGQGPPKPSPTAEAQRSFSGSLPLIWAPDSLALLGSWVFATGFPTPGALEGLEGLLLASCWPAAGLLLA